MEITVGLKGEASTLVEREDTAAEVGSGSLLVYATPCMVALMEGAACNALEGILPDEVLYRKKSPYPKTYDPRYQQLVSAMLDKIINDKNAPLFQIVNRDALLQFISTDSPWPWYGQLMKTPQTIAYMLQVNLWLDRYNVTIL